MSTRELGTRKIPRFASIEEEAQFWDRHDLGEFEDDLEPVDFTVASAPCHSITVSVDSDAFQRLVALAKASGTGPSALARSWVEEELERAAAAQTPSVTSGNR